MKQIVDYIKSIYKTNDPIFLHTPVFIGNEKKYILDCLDSTYVSTTGKYIDQFEIELSKFTKTKKTIAVINGTAALQVALRIAGVTTGNEVITQALTFVATVNAISYLGAQPVFVDVDLDTMGLSPMALEIFLTENAVVENGICINKKTKNKIAACVPMHTFGFPVHIFEIQKICNQWHIPIVEDAAESLGSEYHNQPTGNFGKIAAFSFNGNKIITAGGGGAIVTNDENLAKEAKYLTTTAKVPHLYEYMHDQLGYNYRMPNLNAALICAQIENLQYFLDLKRKNAEQFHRFFNEIGVKFRTELPHTKANYWMMCVELENKKERDLFLRETNENTIMTRPIWQLMYRLPMYQNCQRDAQENAQYLEERIVNIPSGVVIS
jgi:perosamine synthetase